MPVVKHEGANMRQAIFAALVATVLGFCATNQASAGPLEDGISAYKLADYQTAHILLEPLAKRGSPPAQYFLGRMYGDGQGVPENKAEAVKWYRLAADQGNTDAQFFLGIMYDGGQGGLVQNNAEAMKWYRLAADQGNTGAQLWLGSKYFAGAGVPQDRAEAVKWYRLVADKGDAGGQRSLGSMYEHGWGVPQNYVMAHMWYNLAATGGNALGREGRDRIASKMPPPQIAEAQRLAAEWKPK